MKAWMLALIGGLPELVTVRFTSSTTWTAPVGVAMLATLIGCGGAGDPEYEVGYYDVEIVTTLNYSNGTTTTNTTYSSGSGDAPSDYCQGLSGSGSNGSYTGERCHYHTQHYDTVPATTGPSATAFGRTFPGGVGGPGTPQTVNDVPVTLGASYSIVVPPGGSVTISYYR